MRGFLLAALVLIGMDVALTSSASRLANVATPVTGLLVKWLDPAVPLISPGHLSSAAAPASGSPSPFMFLNPLAPFLAGQQPASPGKKPQRGKVT